MGESLSPLPSLHVDGSGDRTAVRTFRLALGPWQDMTIMLLLSCNFWVQMYVTAYMFHGTGSGTSLNHALYVTKSLAGVLSIAGLIIAIWHYSKKVWETCPGR